jgi:hypothetical protein
MLVVGSFALTLAPWPWYSISVDPRTSDATEIMSTVTVQLAPDTEWKLRQQANQVGQTLEAYLERLAERAVANGTTAAHGVESLEQPRYISDPRPSQAEFERLLGDLATGPSLPVLPADFSRADIYDDHD